mgnify:CR=1 FL=1
MRNQIITITQFVDALTDYLEESFEDYHGLSFKCSNDPNSGDNTSKPYIYQYLMPSSELIDGYPNKSPCLVITVDNRNNNDYSLTVHLCVRYDSIAEKEKVHKVADSDIYEYSDDEGYDTQSDIELYKSSLLFNDLVYNLLKQNRGLGLTNIQSELPSPELADFPYSISSVTFDVHLNQFSVSQDPVSDLY